MRRLAACLVMCVSSLAAAEPGSWDAGIDYTIGRGGSARELAYGWMFEAGGFYRRGHVQVTLSAPAWFSMHSSDPERDTSDLAGVGVAGRVAYHVALPDHTDAFVAVGFEHQWLWGQGEVVRPCRLTGECLAGYMTGSVGYHAWAPELRLGVGPSIRFADGLAAASFELIGRWVQMADVPPSGIRDLTITGAMTMTLGWHR